MAFVDQHSSLSSAVDQHIPVLPTKTLNIIIGVSIVRLAVLTRCLEVAKFDGVVSNFCKSGRPYYQTIRGELRERGVQWTRNGME